MNTRRAAVTLAAALALLSAAVWAQDGPSSAPAPAPSADAVLDELLDAGRPTIEPTQRTARPEQGGAEPIKLDPAILGIAPGGELPKLRPEGQFVINRRARLVRSADGMRCILVFEADSASNDEPPMILLPCQLLENMETLAEERGDNLIFLVSGQITIYRGANHLLPTMMRIASDPENIRG